MNEILLYGVIGDEITAEWVRAQLSLADQSEMLTVHIHSEGGSVFEGFAIYESFRAYEGPIRAIIEGAAFSIASFIAMAFDDLSITPNGWMMLHNPTVASSGDAKQLAAQADLLGRLQAQLVSVYAERIAKGVDEVERMLSSETWVSAEQAVSQGFVKRIEGEARTHTLQPNALAIESVDVAMPTVVYASIYSPSATATKERKVMSKDIIAKIKKLVPSASADFLVKCLAEDLDDAGILKAAADEQAAANADLSQQLEEKTAELAAATEYVNALQAELEQVKAKASTPPPKAVGNDPIPLGGGSTNRDARAEWEMHLAAEQSRGVPRVKALMNVNRKYPGLRERMLAEM